MQKIKVLFVCMGNICRSPTAEGVFTQLVAEQKLQAFFEIDSAGTHAYHVGAPPDLRAQKAANERGLDLSKQRARKVRLEDFETFDYILVMDGNNYDLLMEECPVEQQHKVQYFLNYEPSLKTRDVPDPYYGGQYGFEKVLDLTAAAALGFLSVVKAERAI
ncbi:MAG: low molecular weight phosphotyrosine protein phosphatase [Methylococcaceae bacterium]|nr:low molecular weight phosphotyrosine protein phosphatase [Methylococcaceae bacterium]